MKLVTFRRRGAPRIGVVDSDSNSVIDLSVAAPKLPTDMTEFIDAGDRALSAAAKAMRTRKKEARLTLSRRATDRDDQPCDCRRDFDQTRTSTAQPAGGNRAFRRELDRRVSLGDGPFQHAEHGHRWGPLR